MKRILYDRDIREPLFDFLEENWGKVRIIEEKTMGRSRADIVMVTEEWLYGVEIKSDADTYIRLSRQIADYDRYFDSNLIVIGTSHAMHIEEHIPEYWGIITVEESGGAFDFYILRKPRQNPKMRWEKKLEILWRPELAQLQKWNELPGYRGKSKRFVLGKIAERIPDKIQEDVLRKQVSSLLFERDYTTISQTIEEYRKSKQRT